MENFDAEQPMEDLQGQTPKKEPKNPLYDCYSLLHDLVYILAAITIVFVFFVRLVGVDGPSMMPTLQDGDYVALLSNLFMGASCWVGCSTDWGAAGPCSSWAAFSCSPALCSSAR